MYMQLTRSEATVFLDQSNPFLLAPENQSIPLHPEKQYNES